MAPSTWFYSHMSWWEFISWVAVGFALNLVIMIWAWKRHHLTRNAGFVAFMMGFSMWLIEPAFFLLLLTFFISSSVLSKYNRAAKKSLLESAQKGDQRDVIQVLSNGLAAWTCTALYLLAILVLSPPLDINFGIILAFSTIAAIAAPNADTWSTELGTLSRKLPRWIFDLHREVGKGTSGGVSPEGTLAALAGAVLIAILGLLFAFASSLLVRLDIQLADPRWVFAIVIIILSSFGGSIIDSMFGASIQGFFECITCKKGTEKKMHCGNPTVLLRGKSWFDNDVVNFASASIATLITIVATFFLFFQ